MSRKVKIRGKKLNVWAYIRQVCETWSSSWKTQVWMDRASNVNNVGLRQRNPLPHILARHNTWSWIGRAIRQETKISTSAFALGILVLDLYWFVGQIIGGTRQSWEITSWINGATCYNENAYFTRLSTLTDLSTIYESLLIFGNILPQCLNATRIYKILALRTCGAILPIYEIKWQQYGDYNLARPVRYVYNTSITQWDLYVKSYALFQIDSLADQHHKCNYHSHWCKKTAINIIKEKTFIKCNISIINCNIPSIIQMTLNHSKQTDATTEKQQ